MRYTYHWGFRSHDAALEALWDAMSNSEISEGEKPRIESYPITTRQGQKKRQWMITLESSFEESGQ